MISTDRKTCILSVIIPTLNEGKTIESTLSRLTSQQGVEIIVVDGGSTDDTVEKAQALGAQVISATPGRASQMNAGARVAHGEILLFLHGDTLLPEDFLEEISAVLAQPGVAGGAFLLAIDALPWRYRLVECFTNYRARFLGRPYGDQALFLSAGLFRKLGGYKEMELLEDLDLIKRLKKKGRIRIAAQAVQTSARRWQRLGVFKTTLLNQLILLGYFLGLSPARLAAWYRQMR